MSEDESEEKKQPFYKSESFRSAVAGGFVAGGVMKLLGLGAQEIRKKITEFKQEKLEYERKEEERRTEMYAKISADVAKGVLENYLKDRRQPQSE